MNKKYNKNRPAGSRRYTLADRGIHGSGVNIQTQRWCVKCQSFVCRCGAGTIQHPSRLGGLCGKCLSSPCLCKPSQQKVVSNTWGYNNFNLPKCEHFRQPMKCGEWKVYASGLRGYPGKGEKQPEDPDAGVYLDSGWLRKRGGMAVSPGTEWPGIQPWYPAIYCDWPDFSSFHNHNVSLMVGWVVGHLKQGHKVEIGCHGGHGRTGTFLACLLVEVEGLEAKAAITAVRKRVCDNCIESFKQEEQIYEYAGEEPPPRPAPYYSQVGKVPGAVCQVCHTIPCKCEGWKGAKQPYWCQTCKMFSQYCKCAKQETLGSIDPNDLPVDPDDPNAGITLEKGGQFAEGIYTECFEAFCDTDCPFAISEIVQGKLYCKKLCRWVVANPTNIQTP